MYSFGDRVRVSDNWFVEEIRGWIGTIAAPPAGIVDKREEGICWVEFDTNVAENRQHPTTGAEIDADFLTLAEQD